MAGFQTAPGIRSNFRFSLLSEKRYFVSIFCIRNLIQENGSIIHGNAPDNGANFPANQDTAPIGKRQRQSIGIASGNCADANYLR